MHSLKGESTDFSKNGILDANTLCSYASNHSDPRSSISSSCRSSKCCCSSYDCSYCSPPISLNSEAHTIEEGEDDTHHDSLDTIRDEQRSLIPASKEITRVDSTGKKILTPLPLEEKQHENTYTANNIDGTDSPGCKVHHHHHHHHGISSLRTSAMPLRLPLNSPNDESKKNWNFSNDVSATSNKCPTVGSVGKKNSVVIEHIKNTTQLGTKEDNKAQGALYNVM